MKVKDKILDWKTLKEKVREWKRQGFTIVFTNGCFDLLHIGHIRYLEAAKGYGDKLIVAVNSDKSVRAIKGSKKPLVPQEERAELIAALSFVDSITVFDQSTPLELIEYICPDVLVKGSDWAEGEIVGSKTVIAHGGKVIRVPQVEGASTSILIERILKRFCS
ncbi:MAG: hypothetical protein AMJ45_01390 [Syntrophobacter sp. DG_60]|nr:MAG: hypothetical protein AMJ45_01390 [Syntrophobacter sp. DG_60]